MRPIIARNAEVGDYVYEAYKPQNPGIVTAMRDQKRGVSMDRRIDVTWLNGDPSTVWATDCKMFPSLIEQHKQTYDRHVENLKKLLAKL